MNHWKYFQWGAIHMWYQGEDTRSESKSVRLCRAPPQTRMKEVWHQRGPGCLVTSCQIVGYLPLWQLEPVVPFCWALRVTCLNQSSRGINQALEEDKRALPLCEPLSTISHKLAARRTHRFRASPLWQQAAQVHRHTDCIPSPTDIHARCIWMLGSMHTDCICTHEFIWTYFLLTRIQACKTAADNLKNTDRMTQ